MRSTVSKTLTGEDINMIGKTIIQTISKDPLLQRVGVVVKSAPFGFGNETIAWQVYWQPSPSMPYGRPYSSTHSESTLGDYQVLED